MDPIANPFNPGAGSPPPELAGRDDLLETARIAVERLLRNKPSKSMLLIGLRGAGKTVLLDRIRSGAESRGVITIRVEAPENRSLPALLAPQLRLALLKLSQQAKAKEAAIRALRALTGFARALKLNAKYGDIEVGFDYDPEPGLADNGDFEQDLIALLEVVGVAAQKADTAVVLFIDELQYVDEEQLGALTVGLHRCAQLSLPLALFGAGLPQLPGQMGRAKSYAERLFDFPFIGPLTNEAARDAIGKPIAAESCRINDDAIDAIISMTQGYPYFVQQWGKYTWDSAPESPFTALDVQRATPLAIASLDESFFRVRYDRLTTAERRYLRAMAQLGPGPHRSGDIADVLQRPVSSVAPVRAKLLGKGMVWSPIHGDTAFTVPLFDEFLHRVLPGDDWLNDT
jgi:hypothetical protein